MTAFREKPFREGKSESHDNKNGRKTTAKKLKKKPSNWQGPMLEKWITKYWMRREKRRETKRKGASESKDIDRAGNNPTWNVVDRRKIKANSVIRCATWNTQTLLTSDGVDPLPLVAQDLKKRKILIAGLQECRWDKTENGRKVGEYKFWGGGAWTNGAGARQGGVAIAVHKSLWKAVGKFFLVSGRAAVLTIQAQLGKRIVFCTAYCPTENAGEKDKRAFWRDWQKIVNHPDIKVCAADTLIVTGDYNGELPAYDKEAHEKGVPWVVGKWGERMEVSNANGQRLQEEAAQMKLCAASSLIKKPFNRRWTFRLKGADRERQVRNSIRVWDTLHHSDHALVVMDMKLMHVRDKKDIPTSTITKRLRTKYMAEQVGIKLTTNQFAVLDDMNGDELKLK